MIPLSQGFEGKRQQSRERLMHQMITISIQQKALLLPLIIEYVCEGAYRWCVCVCGPLNNDVAAVSTLSTSEIEKYQKKSGEKR